MGPGGPMGPRPPGPPPNHPIMMEMAALDKHLRGLYQQPQTPELHAQIQELQGRMRSLQQQLTQQLTSPWHDGSRWTTGSSSSHDGTWGSRRTNGAWRSRT